ncbi:agmatinase [Candidatus Woesearchaeota archaeon]|nr:agmatinase [Candidatus Woesearchaeota archaeon]
MKSSGLNGSGLNWMNLPEEYCGEDSKFIILPIKYENRVTYGKGALLGGEKIIAASTQLEYYDEQFDVEPFISGIKLWPALECNSAEEMIGQVAKKIEKVGSQQFLIGLGGDHAVTLGLVKGLESKQGDFSILVLDAHSDFRDFWNGSALNHACVSQQLSKTHSLLIAGVRSMDVDELNKINEKSSVFLLKAHEYSLEKLKEILPKLKDRVYVSIDVDVFDPAFIRNTGTPEPGGFSWNQMIDLLNLIFLHKQVIGADIVEFAPVENYRAEAYALAKLAYKLMALKILAEKN